MKSNKSFRLKIIFITQICISQDTIYILIMPSVCRSVSLWHGSVRLIWAP